MFQKKVESLAGNLEYAAIESDLSLDPAAVSFYINKPHSQVFGDFRQLAAKKALASARNSFSSFNR